MNKEKLYYQEPSDEIFNEVKEKILQIWKTKDFEESYRIEKTSHVEKITNIRDNMMHLVAMFSPDGMIQLNRILSDEARTAIRDRIISGGSPEHVFFESGDSVKL